MSTPSAYTVAFFKPRAETGRTVAEFATNDEAMEFARKMNAELGPPTSAPFAIYAVIRPSNETFGPSIVDNPKLTEVPKVIMRGLGCKVTPRKGLI